MFVGSKVATVTVLFVVVGFLQSIAYFMNAFPDALRDFLLNQGLADVDAAPKRDSAASHNGRTIMRQAKTAVIGVGKNLNMQHIDSILSQIGDLSEQFQDYHALLIVDEPSPILATTLQNWAEADPSRRETMQTAPMTVNKWSDGIERPLPREGRIAAARNTGLKALQRSGFHADYVIAVDLDILGWDLGGIEDSFGQSNQWDAVCANGVILHGMYRDVYAFRAPGLNTNHHLSGDDALSFNVTARERSRSRALLQVRRPFSCRIPSWIIIWLFYMQRSKRAVHKLMDGVGSGEHQEVVDHSHLRSSALTTTAAQRRTEGTLVHADSCFGGLAIYR
jgi:hypothetical protein